MAAESPYNPIDAVAAEWVARLDRGEVGDEERRAFEAWLGEDSRHHGAFVRAQAAWTGLDRVVVLSPTLFSRPSARFLPDRRQLLIGGGLAAAASAAGAAMMVMGDRRGHRTAYDTAVGEISQVSLPDGSTATLDTDSRITVQLSKSRRLVQVERGRVWFQVAKNHAWPFFVEAGPTQVRAVGTAFAVSRMDEGSEVVVTEGIVDAWAGTGSRNAALRLERGGRARLTSDEAVRLPSLASNDIDRILAWREGYLALDGETLAEAAAAFNHYNSRKIVVADARLSRRRLVGYFRIQDPQGFADAAATSLGATVEEGGDRILLTPAGGDAAGRR